MFVQDLVYQGHPDDIAIDGESQVSYQELQARVKQYRDYFYSIGMRQGDNVGLFSKNSPAYIYAYMAIAGLGAVVVPINFQLTMREVAYIVKDAEMKFFISDVAVDLSDGLAHYHYGQRVVRLLLSEIEALVQKQVFASAPKLPSSFTEEDVCVIIYTSGTTGNPKGAMLTHKNQVSNAKMFKQSILVSKADNVLCVLPMYHCFAWTCSVLNPFYSGARITILDAFNPKETVVAIQRYQVSVIYAVPPICNILTRIAPTEALQNVHTFVVGGAALPAKIAEDFYEKFKLNILEGYGLSEASPVVAVNSKAKHRQGSIGCPLPEVEVKIMSEAGDALPRGKVGELMVRGDNVMKGYYHLPEETKQALEADGWLHTGDVAYQDDDDFLFIVDRLKDMIISKGENVYPREVEELLYAYPGIVEAAVIGKTDRLRGQFVAAYLVTADNKTVDKKSLKEYLQQNLAIYKVPREINIVDHLPKSQTGKILKRLLSK